MQTGNHYLASAELDGPNVLKVKLPRLLAFNPFDFGPCDVSGNVRHAKVTGSPTRCQVMIRGRHIRSTAPPITSPPPWTSIPTNIPS